MSGAITIVQGADGRWTLSVGGRKPRSYDTLAAALGHAADISFAPGEGPGSWRVLINER